MQTLQQQEHLELCWLQDLQLLAKQSLRAALSPVQGQPQSTGEIWELAYWLLGWLRELQHPERAQQLLSGGFHLNHCRGTLVACAGCPCGRAGVTDLL